MSAETLSITFRQQAAMRKAREEKVRSFKLSGLDHRGFEVYMVRSTQFDVGAFHAVAVNPKTGKIVDCSNCPGWHRAIKGSAEYTVCKHAGCVANRIITDRFGWRVLNELLDREIPSPVIQLPGRRSVPDQPEDRSVADPIHSTHGRNQIYQDVS